MVGRCTWAGAGGHRVHCSSAALAVSLAARAGPALARSQCLTRSARCETNLSNTPATPLPKGMRTRRAFSFPRRSHRTEGRERHLDGPGTALDGTPEVDRSL